jgi:short-subunit dehydrogenase
MDFAGRGVFITGASSGIGEALAREFARQGAKIALLARRVDRLERLASELVSAGAGAAISIPCDVTHEGDLERAAERAERECGSIDVVVANAGFGVFGPFSKLTLEDYRRQFETNVFGVLRTIFATLPALERSGGRLALMGSVAGHVGLPGRSAYAMSKFAVRGMALALRHELALRGVQVVLLSPGFVQSEIYLVDNRGQLREGAKSSTPAWLRMPADRAAREMVEAIRRGRREQVITKLGKAAVLAQRHAPWLVQLGVGVSQRRRRRA